MLSEMLYNPNYTTKIAMDTIGLYMNANNLKNGSSLGKGKYPLHNSKCRKIFDNRNIIHM